MSSMRSYLVCLTILQVSKSDPESGLHSEAIFHGKRGDSSVLYSPSARAFICLADRGLCGIVTGTMRAVED